MSHVLFFSNWKNQNIDALTEMISTDLIASFSESKDMIINCGYDRVIGIFKDRFAHDQDWQFDIITRYIRGSEEIVIANIFREDQAMHLLEKKSVGLFVFEKADRNIQLVRVHLEMELE